MTKENILESQEFIEFDVDFSEEGFANAIDIELQTEDVVAEETVTLRRKAARAQESNKTHM